MLRVSIVICTYNRENYLKNVLESLINQNVDKSLFEVLVVDNNSKDNTREVVNSFYDFLPIRYTFEKQQGLVYARNQGIKEAKGEFIAFVDDDAVVDKNYLKYVLKDLEKNKNWEIFGGKIIPLYNHNKPEWYKDKYEGLDLGSVPRLLSEREFLYGSNIIIKRDIFECVGNFSITLGERARKFNKGDETEWQIRAKKQNKHIFYDPKLIIYHLSSPQKTTIRYLIKQAQVSGFIYWGFYSYNLKDILKNFIIFLGVIVGVFVRSLLYVFRDREKYPFWQNYFLEKLYFPFIRFFSLLMVSILQIINEKKDTKVK